MKYDVNVSIRAVIGGFIVSYPKFIGDSEHPFTVTEVTTTLGKAMRVAKAALEEFSLVKKDDGTGE